MNLSWHLSWQRHQIKIVSHSDFASSLTFGLFLVEIDFYLISFSNCDIQRRLIGDIQVWFDPISLTVKLLAIFWSFVTLKWRFVRPIPPPSIPPSLPPPQNGIVSRNTEAMSLEVDWILKRVDVIGR